jgi:hypothetical protein
MEKVRGSTKARWLPDLLGKVYKYLTFVRILLFSLTAL